MKRNKIVRFVSILALVVLFAMIIATAITAFTNSQMFFAMLIGTILLSVIFYVAVWTAKWLSTLNNKNSNKDENK